MSIINFYSYKGGVGCEGAPIGAVLEWMPRALPRGAIVVSTSTSVVSAELRKLGFRAFSAGPLEGKTLEAIIRLSFIRFGKPLGSDAIEGIVKTMRERTAAYARTFVELLRQYGLFEDLNSEIKRRLRRRRHPRAPGERRRACPGQAGGRTALLEKK
jgi:hypothetical protein